MTIRQFVFCGLIAFALSIQHCSSVKKQEEKPPIEGQITNLQVEGFDHWIVTDEPMPKLSWKPLADTLRDQVIGYELLASDSERSLNAGIGSIMPFTIQAIESGPYSYLDVSHLPSRSSIWWHVRAVMEDNTRGEWSPSFNFEIGLKEASDWDGKWIGMHPEQRGSSAPWFRNSFEIEKSIAKARLYVSGLGLHESWINGTRVGNDLLQPAQTDYDIRSFYVAHDITELLLEGENTLGIWVGDGFYNQDRVWGKNGLSYGEPKVLAQLEITYQDGNTSTIFTDEKWKCRLSPIKSSNVYAGEEYDARIYKASWASNDTDTEDWQSAISLPAPGGKRIAQSLPPVRVQGKVSVLSISELNPGTWIFDFGQNLVGWAKLKVDASSGTEIIMRFAEDRLPSGELNFATGGVSSTKVIQTDIYTAKGKGEEVWEPRFSNHGFRYAEVTIANGKLANEPTKDMLEGVVIHTDMPIVGDFSSSDETLNKAFEMAHWTQTGSVLGVPVDCPVRERCGWTGDAHLTVPYTMYRFDAASMWRKYATDISTTAQRSSPILCFGDEFGERTVQIKKAGIPTMTAPGKRFIGEGSPDWGSAMAFIPWDIYLFTGDQRSLDEHYPSIRQWTEHLDGLATDGIVYSGMGDWCKPITDNPENKTARQIYGAISPMLSTACFYRSARITADAARLLGRQEDYTYFDNLAGEIRIAFTKAFYSNNSQLIPDQTINAIAIDWGVLAPELHALAAENLNRQVQKANYHFETGVFGMPSLWDVLGRFGYHESAWKALQNETAPSLKYLMERGATTFWEVWPTEKDVNEPYAESMSHPFQGAFVSWFYKGLAGIKPDAEQPGFRLIHLEPQVIAGLEWVECTYDSPMGKIESSWKQDEKTLTWTVEIPTGATAQLRIPGELTSITIGKEQLEAKTVKITDAQGLAERVSLTSGRYLITSVKQ